MSRRWKLLVLSSLVVLQWLCLVTTFQRPAYGYVDPGSGMLVLQFAGSILSGGIFFLRKKLKQFFFPAKSTSGSQGTSRIEP
jgi:hypothetical protein